MTEAQRQLEALEAKFDTLAGTRPGLSVTLLASPQGKDALARHMKAVAEWEKSNPLAVAVWREVQRLTEVVYRERLAEADMDRRRQLWAHDMAEHQALVATAAAAQARPMVVVAREWDWTKAPALVLLGSVGVGKSVAAAVAAERVVLATGRHCRWLEAKLDCRVEKFGWAGTETRERWCGAGVLVVDDLGSEPRHDEWVAFISGVLEVRLDKARPTIITSNATVQDLGRWYGARLADRLQRAEAVQAEGRSQR